MNSQQAHHDGSTRADIRTSVQCADITATRNITGIWRNGTRQRREPLPAPRAARLCTDYQGSVSRFALSR